MLSSYVLAFSQSAIATLFAYSVLMKVLNVREFEETVSRFALLPLQVTRLGAWCFLAAEALTPVLVFTFVAAGLLFAILLLLIFNMALASVLIRGIKTSCRCFGRSRDFVSVFELLRNAAFILCAAAGLPALLATGGSRTNLSIVDWVFVGCAAILFVCVMTQVRDLARLLWPPRM